MRGRNENMSSAHQRSLVGQCFPPGRWLQAVIPSCFPSAPSVSPVGVICLCGPPPCTIARLELQLSLASHCPAQDLAPSRGDDRHCCVSIACYGSGTVLGSCSHGLCTLPYSHPEIGIMVTVFREGNCSIYSGCYNQVPQTLTGLNRNVFLPSPGS